MRNLNDLGHLMWGVEFLAFQPTWRRLFWTENDVGISLLTGEQA
jgi:hypothetical protein